MTVFLLSMYEYECNLLLVKTKDMNGTDSASKLRNELGSEHAKNEALTREVQLLKERLHSLERAQADLEVSRFEATRLKAQIADLMQVRTHSYMYSILCLYSPIYCTVLVVYCGIPYFHEIDVMRGLYNESVVHRMFT